MLAEVRHPDFPDIPTLREQGYGKDGGDSWFGILAPVGTPLSIVARLDKAIAEALRSPDVIHDFGIPGFLMKMDVIPGRYNHYRVTPTVEGDYRGKCYELCGVYHSRMIFNVRVVSLADYESYLQDLEALGNVSDVERSEERRVGKECS